jgi:hypothetical protein
LGHLGSRLRIAGSCSEERAAPGCRPQHFSEGSAPEPGRGLIGLQPPARDLRALGARLLRTKDRASVVSP